MSRTWRPVIRQRQWLHKQKLTGARPDSEGPRAMTEATLESTTFTLPGADYAWTHPSPSALRAAGIRFVCRYLSRDPSKNITAAEVKALRAVGIMVVAVWESGAQDMLRGHAGGVTDAQAADLQARACGLDGIPIYFAADWDALTAGKPVGEPFAALSERLVIPTLAAVGELLDEDDTSVSAETAAYLAATASQQALIDGYLDGAASVLGDDRARNLYGGFWPCSRARAAGKAHRIWGTYAWSGSNWVTCGWTPHIMQQLGLVSIGGVQCDADIAHFADFGQWPRPVSPPPLPGLPAAAPAAPVTWGLAATSAHGSWKAVAGASGYRVRAWSASPVAIVHDHVTTGLSEQMTGLRSGHRYGWHVAAVNAHGVGPWCPNQHFTTK